MAASDIAHLENQLDLMRKLDEVSRVVSRLRPRLEREMAAARRAEAAAKTTPRGVSVARSKQR